MKTRFVKILILASCILVSMQTYAQKKTHYTATTGKKSTDIIYDYSKHNGLDRLIFSTHGNTTIQDMDSKCKTIFWKISKPEENTEVTVECQGGKFLMKGKVKGKAVSKTFDGEGHPWYQHIALAAAKNLSKGGSLTFVCIRPDQLDFHVMTATDMGFGDIGQYKNARKIKVAPTGAFAKLWSCDYYLDPETGEYVGYKAVEGPPGTPLTTWLLVK